MERVGDRGEEEEKMRKEEEKAGKEEKMMKCFLAKASIIFCIRVLGRLPQVCSTVKHQ